MNARGAAKGKKAENESEEARNIHTACTSLHQLPRNPNHCRGEIACRICAFDKGRNGLSKEEENGACVRNQVMPYLKRPSDLQRQVPEKKIQQASTTRHDHKRHFLTVEVHPEPNDRS